MKKEVLIIERPSGCLGRPPHVWRRDLARPLSAGAWPVFFTLNFRRLIVAVLMCIMYLFPADADATRSYKILVLFSFHSDMDWTERIKGGLESRLADKGLDFEIIYEYMDVLRYSGKEFEERLCALIRYKLAFKPFDVVITAHNYAFNYLSAHRDWFGSMPWIFCGVDDEVYMKSKGVKSHSTGLTVVPDIPGTLEIALRLHPDRNQVFVIVDSARTRQSFLKSLDTQRLKFKNRAEIKLVDTPSLDELQQLLRSMPANALLLILPFARDKDGNYFPFQKVKELLRTHGHVPAYTLWENQLGDGIMGGKMINFADQGRGAADMALRIIRGERPEAIPVVRGQVDQYMFNDRELKRFAVPSSALPVGSVVVNKPSSFYTVNKEVIWILLGHIIVLFLLTLYLIFNIKQLRRAEKQLVVSAERFASEHEQRKHLSRRLIDLLEMDRRDVARELHDHIGQIMTTLKLDLAALKTRLTADQKGSETFIDDAEEKLNQVMKGVKDMARGLRPVTLELQGLRAALQSLMTDLEESSGLSVHFFCGDLPDRIDSDCELALFRIAQEALNNAIKHADARNLHVNLIKRDYLLSLSIEDDGDGFDPDAVLNGSKASQSLGLILMRERALQVGGTFQVDSRIGQGANILVELPLTSC